MARWGAKACAAALLVLGVFVAPYIETVQEFLHDHPAGTPEHVHPLTMVLGPLIAVGAVDAAPALAVAVVWLLPAAIPHILRRPSTAANGIRAPPGRKVAARARRRPATLAPGNEAT